MAQTEPVDLAASGRAHQGRALDELIAGEGEEPPLGRGEQGVARAADTLERGGDGARRADQAGEIHRAHVDAELERRGRHHQRELARLEPLLGVEAPLPAQAAVVRGHPLGAEALGQMARHPLDQTPRVDEHQRRAVRPGELGDAIVDLLPLLVGTDRSQLVADHLDGQVHVAALAHVDDLGQRPLARPPGAAPRSGSAARWPRGRSAAGARPARPPAPRAARATGPGARHACRPPPRESRPRSRCARRASQRRLDSAVSRMKSDSGVVTMT